MSRRSSIALVLMLVVTSVVPAGPIGTAAAEHGSDQCTEFEDAVYVLTNGGFGQFPECKPSHLSDQIQEMEQNDQNESKAEIYNAFSNQKKDQEDHLLLLNNYRQDTRTPAMAKAEAAAIEAIEAGKNRSEVKAAARQAVQDYYAQKQINLVEKWNSEVTELYTLDKIRDENNISSDFLRGKHNNTESATEYGAAYWVRFEPSTNETVTLTNGSNVNSKAIVGNFSEEDGANNVYYEEATVNVTTGNATADPENTYDGGTEWYAIRVQSVDTNPSIEGVRFTKWASDYQEFESQSTQMTDNAEAWAETVYNKSQDGSVNASEYIDPLARSQEWTQQYNESGYWAYSLSSLGSLGFAHPELNGTGMMTISYNGTTHEGMILSSENPASGSWDAGTTYNTVNFNGTVFLSTVNNGTVKMSGSFTVDEIKDKDGEVVNQTKNVEYHYRTVDNSNYTEMQNRIRLLREEIEARENTTSGGGTTTDSGWSFPDLPPEVLAALAIVALLLLKD